MTIRINPSGHRWMDCTRRTARTWVRNEMIRLTDMEQDEKLSFLESRIEGISLDDLGVVG